MAVGKDGIAYLALLWGKNGEKYDHGLRVVNNNEERERKIFPNPIDKTQIKIMCPSWKTDGKLTIDQCSNKGNINTDVAVIHGIVGSVQEHKIYTIQGTS